MLTTAVRRGVIKRNPPARRKRSRGHREAIAFSVVLAAGAALRLWQLSGKPDWQYDEAVYARVATNILQHGTLNEHINFGAPWQPFLYQPPFYPLILARWFALTGPSIYHARILGVVASVAMIAVFFRLAVRLHGPRVALISAIPVVFDGWLMYVERASYIENLLMLLIVTGMLGYQRALDRPSAFRFALAGAMFGFAICFKLTAVYALPAVALCWLIKRRERWDHRGHLTLLATAVAVVALYVLIMIRLFDVPGHDWFLQETAVQFRRVLGVQRSGGTLTSPGSFVHLLLAQYRVFIPSLLACAGAFVIAARRTARCYRTRSWLPLQDNALLFAWLAAGIVVFGLSALRFPQYFALIMVPAYGFLWSEVFRWERTWNWKTATACVAVAGGIGSFWLRVPMRSDNVFAQVQHYASASIPRRSVVVTEEMIGDLIAQPWCRVEQAAPCLHYASYAITWKTYLQSSFSLGDSAFHQVMRGAVPIRRFSGFSGTATVWRLRTTG